MDPAGDRVPARDGPIGIRLGRVQRQNTGLRYAAGRANFTFEVVGGGEGQINRRRCDQAREQDGEPEPAFREELDGGFRVVFVGTEAGGE